MTLDRYWEKSKETSLEQIRKSNPDLIVSGKLEVDEQTAEQLSRQLSDISTFEAIEWKQYSWKRRLLELASRLDLKMIAEKWLSDYKQKVDNAKRLMNRVFKSEAILLVCVRDGEYLLGLIYR